MEANTTKPIQTIQADVKDIQKDINDLKCHVKLIKSSLEQLLYLQKQKKDILTTVPTGTTGWFW
tara:strand:- start:411 stop:602 length:192 start_codon:yes stop_codon:yes gene_type:complete